MFMAVFVVADQKFAWRFFGITDLRRHKRQPFFKSFAAQKIVLDLAVPSAGAAYQPDAVELGDEHANVGVHSLLDGFGDTTRDLFRMDREKQATPEFGNELEVVGMVVPSR